MTTTKEIAAAVKTVRHRLKLRQAELAAAANVGVRFLIELEASKPTARLGKTLAVLNALGLDTAALGQYPDMPRAGRYYSKGFDFAEPAEKHHRPVSGRLQYTPIHPQTAIKVDDLARPSIRSGI